MTTNDGAWEKHKYKAREWVKGSWKYIYDTAKKTTDKTKETVKEVSSKVSNLKDNTKDDIQKSKEYIANKFETAKDKAEKIIDSKLNDKKQAESINSTFYKHDTVTYQDTSKVYKYKYTELISEVMADNPIPTTIGLGLAALSGTAIPVLLGIGIVDVIIAKHNIENEAKARQKANEDARNEQYKKDLEKDRQERDEKRKKFSDLTVDEFRNLSDEEKRQFKIDKPFEYSILDAKSDDRESQAIDVTDAEANEMESKNNPGFWAEVYDLNNDFDENCWICTMAYGEQRKGNDVYPDDENDARGLKYNLYTEDILKLYDNPKPIDFGYNYNGYDSSEQSKIIDTMLDTYPEGSYGNMEIQLLDAGGHSVFWEVKNGELIVRDTQMDAIIYSKSSSNDGKYYVDKESDIETFLSYSWNCIVYRTDNIDLKPNVTDNYLKDRPDYKLSNSLEQTKEFFDLNNQKVATTYTYGAH